MAHNFKLTGDYYVSVDGSDSNNGLTKDTPKRTIQSVLTLITSGTRSIIIGSGVYSETLIHVPSSNFNVSLFADGYVVLDGRNTLSLSFYSVFGGSNATFNFYNLEIRNYPSISLFNSTNGTGGTNHLLFDCKLSNNIINQYGGNLTNSSYTRCLFINTTFNFITGLTQLSTLSYLSCIFINSKQLANPQYSPTSFINNYIDPFSVIVVKSGSLVANINYNNIQGVVIMAAASVVTSGIIQDIYGRYYDLSITTSTGSGTIGDPYGRPYTSGTAFSFNSHRTAYPTYNVNSFALDPKFNNIEAQDFTLQADSPHIGRAQNGIDNIGGTRYAIRHSAKGDAFNISAVSVTSLNFLGDDYVITSPSISGEVISAPILVSSSGKILQKISYNGLFEFNKAITPPTAGNRNVPDQEVYDSTSQPPNVAGANPDRLVYYMRYSTQSTQPTTNSEWDNGGYWTAGNYGTFEWNTKPSIDNVFLGNGDPAFNSAATPTFLTATWIQLKVKLRNDYA